MVKKYEDYATFKKRVQTWVLSAKQLREWAESDYAEAYVNHYDDYAAQEMGDDGHAITITTNKREADDSPADEPPSKKQRTITVGGVTVASPDGNHGAVINDKAIQDAYKAEMEKREKEVHEAILKLHPNIDSDPLHGKYYTVVKDGKGKGKDRYDCTETTPEDIFQHCFMDWWTPEQWKIMIALWKKKMNLTYVQMYDQLNANRGYWKEVNLILYQEVLPYDPNNFNSVKYYTEDVPRGGVTVDWIHSKYFEQWGDTNKKEYTDLLSGPRALVMSGLIAANNAHNAIDDTAKEVKDYFNSYGFKALLIAILGIAAVGSGAALVHEIKK